MTVSKRKENYLISEMELTKKQIKELLPSEIKAHCNKVIRKEIDDLGIYRPEEDKQKINRCAKRQR
jgi:hypothetical protein